jgi:hypothetical protein
MILKNLFKGASAVNLNKPAWPALAIDSRFKESSAPAQKSAATIPAHVVQEKNIRSAVA